MNRQLLSTALGLLVLLAAASLRAAPPWEVLAQAKKVDADPNSNYAITQNNGPWMIMAHTFQGDKADEQAKALVLELRSKYKLPAYAHTKTFDFTQRIQGRGFDAHGKPKVMRYQQAQMMKEVAVLVGDYNTVDDPGAQKVLAKIKQMQPEALKDADSDANQPLSAFRQLQQRITGLEEAIADRRELYNNEVNINNTRIDQFPDALIARRYGFTARPLLEFAAAEKSDVDVGAMFKR